MIHGVRLVLSAERIGASNVRSITLATHTTSQIDESLGARIAQIPLLTGVMSVTSTMQTGAIVAQMMRIVTEMVTELSMTIVIALMLSSTLPIAMNACSLA
jgi:hypothetical protein